MKKYNVKPRLSLYNTALQTYGVGPQRTMLVEEIGELLNALAKFARCRATQQDIISELADVYIMVEQTANYYGWDEFTAERDRKLERLSQRLKGLPHEQGRIRGAIRSE